MHACIGDKSHVAEEEKNGLWARLELGWDSCKSSEARALRNASFLQSLGVTISNWELMEFGFQLMMKDFWLTTQLLLWWLSQLQASIDLLLMFEIVTVGLPGYNDSTGLPAYIATGYSDSFLVHKMDLLILKILVSDIPLTVTLFWYGYLHSLGYKLMLWQLDNVINQIL